MAKPGRAGLFAVIVGLLFVLFGTPAALAQTDDTTDTTATGDTTSDTGTDGEVVVVEEEEDNSWIVYWGGAALIVIIAIGLIWYFFLRDRVEEPEE